PIMSSTLLMPGDNEPMTDPREMLDRLQGKVEAVIDGGAGGMVPSSVVDLTSGSVEIHREGKGDTSAIV
ncbi:MAG: Sua5/YciO/YrdC/YwlC family protein, partial [Pseudomonadota bacterium]